MAGKAVAKLRAQLAQPDHIVVCPGVQDGLSARVALREGFENLYMTGAGTAMVRLGMPDLGLTTQDDMVSNAAMIASLDRNVPVIADADTGFGGPLMVARTVERYIAAGVAGLHLEDQAQTKRCGHLLGKEIVDADTFAARIRAAVHARRRCGGDIVIIARTDALQTYGFDEAVARLRAAVAAGADVAFLEGMTNVEQMQKLVDTMAPTPCFLNMVNGGVTPLVTSDQARQMGYKIVIWPCFAMTAAYLAYRRAARELRRSGVISERYRDQEQEQEERQQREAAAARDVTGREIAGGVREIFEVCGLSECAEFDKMCGGRAYANGV